jgi:replication factor A1
MLTPNAVRTIIAVNSRDDPTFAPIVQVIQIRPVNNTGPPRYRLVLSDGDHFIQGMLATQLNDMVHVSLNANSIIRISEFMNNYVQGKNIIIVLRLDIVDNPGTKIGEPIDIEKAGNIALKNSNNTRPQASAAPMYNRTNVDTAAVSSPMKSNSNPYASPGGGSNNPYSPPNKRNPTAPIVHRSMGDHTVGGGDSMGGPKITMISQLNMYQNRFTIKARVTSKSDIRTWSNAKGEGSLFSMDVLDSSGMDIRVTMFKEAVEKFYNFFIVGSVYTITGGKLKVANMQYNTCKSSLEMTLDQNAEVHKVDDAGDIQVQAYDFVKISDLEQVEEKRNVDLIAIVQEVSDVQSLTSKKTGQELQKCDVTLIDDTGVQIRLTLWGHQAMTAKDALDGNKVVAFRRARVSDYGGKSLSGGDMHIEPRISETEALRQWWSTQGSRAGAVKSLSNSGGAGGKMDNFNDRKSIADIKNQNMGYNNAEKGDFLSFKGRFTFLKKDKEGGAWYTACPNKEEPCRNRVKVTQTTDGNWQCDRCHGTYPTCTRKWLFTGTVSDDRASTWVSIFDEQAYQLLGVTADDVFAQYENQDVYDGYFAKAQHTEWVFKCRVKNEMVNDEPRVKTQVVRMDPVDYAAECREMFAAMERL